MQQQTDPALDAGAPITLDPVSEAAQTAPPLDSAPTLQERLAKAEAELEAMRDAWLRAKAETENLRKRAQADIAQAHKFAIENFAQQLLAVRDSLEAALKTSQENVQSLLSGSELTLKQLTSAFERFALLEINPQGEKFDPRRHQGISTVESEQPANTVVQVLQKGYQLNDRVLRPALVIIAKAKEV